MLSKILFFLICLLFVHSIFCDEYNHKYGVGDPVILYANHVGPHYNPQETYGYYTLPFCRPPTLEYKFPSIGEALQGMELVKSEIPIVFGENVFKRHICTVTLTSEVVQQFLYAVEHQYYYQLYLDDLPMWATVGGIATKDNDKTKNIPFIFTHKKFVIGYNNDRIVEVNLTAEAPVPLKEGTNIKFTYSVKWVPSKIEFAHRFRRYLDYNFFEHKIHWFSIFNSFMMVVFLAGLVFMILVRTLRSDLAKYTKDVEQGYDSDSEFADESGWKQIHGDVFRAPPYLELFSVLIGTGWQLMLLMFFLIFFAILGSYYDSRGALLTAFIVIYSMTSFVSGYYSASYYAQNGGIHWIRTMLMTATMFPLFCFIVGAVLNTIALIYSSLMAVPFGTIVIIFVLWAFITVPLVVLGTIVGRNIAGKPNHPCRVNQIPSPIPQKPWYLKRITFILLGGILPFGSIFIEMYFIFTSFWNYKYYYVYGFMLLVYIILIIVTMSVSIVSTYFLLNAEDHRWVWTSFLSSASTSLYVFIYSIYFFYAKTKMTGLFQVSFYFGYMLLFCFGLAILCGTVGFIGTNLFVRRIYRDIKVD